MTHEQADSGNVNPGIETADNGSGYYTNCQSCVVAYEARLRGYDVEAKPQGNNASIILGYNPNMAWLDSSGNIVDKMHSVGNSTTSDELYKELNNLVNIKERYVLSYTCKTVAKGNATNGLNVVRGHIINVYKDSVGDLILCDNQRKSSEKNTWIGHDEICNYIDSKISKNYIFSTYEAQYLRVDNLNLNFDMANNVLRKKV